MLGSLTALILLLALALDAVIGDPDWLWRRLPHPVVLFGRLIGWLDRRLNSENGSFGRRRMAGVWAVAVLTATAALCGLLLHWIADNVPFGMVLEVVVVAVLLAQRSLYDHVARVAAAFRSGGLVAARRAVSQIVGRDPESLDTAGVCRAAIETTAENFSDGVVAPAFWYLICGLPGLLVYKAVNTADSMIGHKSERYLAFGWAAARFDDVLNLVPARLAGLILTVAAPLVGGSAAGAFGAMWHDAGRHRSPNAGWPEAAMAGAFGLALAGPRRYGGQVVDDAWMNAGGRVDAAPDDIGRALRLLVAGSVVLAALVAGVATVAA
jgi:adenosylcobinamide-phosphate synthase